MAALSEAVRREIGQHFVFGFHGQDVDDNIRSLITEYFVGNVIIMKRNIQSSAQVKAVTDALQKLAKDSGHEKPLLIGTDQENGLVSAFSLASGEAGTQFPGAMALAATGSTELTERVYRATAEELRAAGINWAYSPVADVNSDHRNPVIGVRSFGDDPHEVARFTAAAHRGLASGNVIACAKHFPGHGDTHVDSHLALPRIMKSRAELDATELVPFKALVGSFSSAEPIPSIMTGHMALPNITGDDTPCSLSRAVTTGLLRIDMKYSGVIVTDCLEMEAVAETYGSEGGAVMSLEAGADIVMICHRIDRQRGALEATYRAIEQGRLFIDELRISGERIRALKDKYCGTWNDVATKHILDSVALAKLKRENLALAQEAYATSIALVRDLNGTLPLVGGASAGLALFTPQMESVNLAVDDAEGVLRTADGTKRNTAGPSYLALAQALSAHVENDIQHVVYTPQSADAEFPDLGGAKSVVFALRNADRSAWQLDMLRRVVDAARAAQAKLVLVSTCTPYDLLDVEIPGVREAAYLATFEFTKPALETAANVIFGVTKPTGKVPVLGGKV
ncbi:glycoside hydrolase [Punctularia strigosozonata HHB-11173 SS5]|uniref:glycoside hydrolase n=1 Tax=Punctularia strigosozonata (strain HHB-11173) TaxID=741275 RepID=UPI0004418685|nr:glycoside hydrolase [Punctularia strigosozonata HHB-11173 SS5]EIN05844.1 glycoside hydrolase [Punctularia strigosozonata HHB-11173 SS5]